jgi:transposase, IS5 family
MKTEGHFGRYHLKGREGDAASVILPAVAYDLSRVLACLRAPLRLILLTLAPAFASLSAVTLAF